MKTASVRDLRNNFARVSEWIEAGESILLTKRGKPVARITPLTAAKSDSKRPDFLGRLERIFGSKIVKDSQEIIDYGRGDR